MEKLFDVRSMITEHDKELPRQMENASPDTIRILERIFELNTSALTTIEAYFRIFKIAVASGKSFDSNTVNILNEWLEFINTQCLFDLEYLETTIKETRDIAIMAQLQTAKNNIQNLADISATAINQNNLSLSHD
jgi:hypothetical protein